MGQAVDVALVYGPGNYIVMEQGDTYFCRETGIISAGAGKFEAGHVLTLLKADRVVNGVTLPAGTFASYADGDDNAVVLWERIDARVQGAKRTLTARDTQVHAARMIFGFAANDTQLRIAYSLLAQRGILMR